MSGDKPTHITLQLDLMAKNLLVEFPKSREYITSNKGDENIWYFDCDIYAMEGA